MVCVSVSDSNFVFEYIYYCMYVRVAYSELEEEPHQTLI